MLRVLIILTFVWTTLAGEKKFGYFTLEYTGLSDPLTWSEIESSPVKYHFRLSRKNKREKKISATFQVSRKIVDLKIQSILYRLDRTAGYVLEIQRPPISFCYEEEPVYPVLKRDLGWSVDKANCSWEKGNYTLFGYSLEEETKGYLGNKSFYGHFKSRILFLEGNEDRKVAGVDIDYENKEVKDFKEQSNDIKQLRKKIK